VTSSELQGAFSLSSSEGDPMTIRKYMSEAGLHMDVQCVLQMQQEDFFMFENPQVKDLLANNPCYLYMLVRRPKITVDPASLKVEPEAITAKLLAWDGIRKKEHTAKFPNLTGVENLTASSPYPHNRILLFDEKQQQVADAKVSLLAQGLRIGELRHELAFEVMYVGQAYGGDGSRAAADRLQKHETLQAIYSETIAKMPDHEVWILLLNFNPGSILSFDGRSGYSVSDEEDDAHMHSVLEMPITDQQLINLTEAALIRHFQPPFNKVFKNKFPSSAHKTYSQCYDLDLNAIVVEVDTSNVKSEIWSSSRGLDEHHIASFPLHSPEERRSMFEMLIPDQDGVEKWVKMHPPDGW